MPNEGYQILQLAVQIVNKHLRPNYSFSTKLRESQDVENPTDKLHGYPVINQMIFFTFNF